MLMKRFSKEFKRDVQMLEGEECKEGEGRRMKDEGVRVWSSYKLL